MRHVAAAIVFLGASALIVHTQSALPAPTLPSGAISFSGRVLADDSGDPVTNARVAVTPAVGLAPVVLTNSDGRFTLTSLPPARYTVTATKAGYARSQLSPTAGGQRLEIRLRRSAAIEGRVVDESGDPVPGVRVTAESWTGAATTTSTVATAETDDRGDYRLGGLAAGRVAISVTVAPTVTIGVGAPNGGRLQKTYYPGVTNMSDAEWVPVHAGDDRLGIDFVVPPNQSTMRMVGMVFVFPLARTPDSNVQATGAIRGRVVSADGRPLARAQMVLMSDRPFQRPRLVTADENGQYDFSSMPAGAYIVSADKLGYSSLEMGPASLFGPGRRVELADGETRERVDFTLVRWGALSGRLFDENGDPVEGASVQLLQVRFEAGRRQLVMADVASRLTDDLGRYRIFGVPPGDYVVSAAIGQVGSPNVPGYARAYLPGTPNPGEARFVTIGRSQDIVSLDFSLSRIQTAHVKGHAFNAAGEPTTAGKFELVPSQRSGSVIGVSVGARTLPDGTFDFPNVPPGEYVVRAYRGRSNPSTEGEFGVLAVVVNGTDVTDLVLRTSPGSTITGHLSFDGADPPQGKIDLSPLPIDADFSPWGAGAIAHAQIHGDGTFEMAGITGKRRLQVVDAPKGWALKAVLVDGLDVTDLPLSFGRRDQSLNGVEVVLTSVVTVLSGTVAEDHARPAPGATVIVCSIDRDRWYQGSRFLRKTVAGPDGSFSAEGLPQGNYYVRAIAQAPITGEDGWQDPAFLESLVPGASTVALTDGQAASLSLQLSR